MNILGNMIKIKDKMFFEVIDQGKLNHLFVPILVYDGTNLYNKIALIETAVEPDYDYDYDEHLIVNDYIETKIYHVVSFCPYSGEKFNFVVREIIDKTAEYEKLLEEEKEWLEKRKSAKKLENLSRIDLEKEKLMQLPVIFDKNGKNIYTDEDMVSWLEIMER